MFFNIKLWVKLMFGYSESGSIVVSSNVPEIIMRTHRTPRKVFISLTDPCLTHACGISQDWFDVKIIPKGFIIKCNIKNSYRKITWLVI